MAINAVVHLVDDDEQVRRALAFLLGTAGMAVRLHESALQFLEKLNDIQPGCIVSDVRMPGMDGLSLQRTLKEKGIDMPMIIMTGHADVALAVAAMKAGAVDFIEKPFDDESLLGAVRLALSRYDAAGQSSGEIGQIRARAEGLSARERQVMEGLLAGHPNKTIAYDLAISPRTVEVHRANVMTKMAAKSLPELVRMAMLAGLLETSRFQKNV
jgi:two-component system, LuxR family, response regulator FixJ